MFEQAFKNIDDVLWKEAGCTTELDFTEQTSWLLFVKYLDGLEQDRADEAALSGKTYTYILDKPYRWETWAAPKGRDGKLDHNAALTGDDLRDFVNLKLFPYLRGFTQRATGPDTIEYKVGQIFGEIKNKISSGYNLREIMDHIDELRFRSQVEKHELSALYEEKIKRMGNAGRNLGKTNPLNDDDLAEFVNLQKTFADSGKSWSVDARGIDPATFDLSVKNPNNGEEIDHLPQPAGDHG
jgi:type I restriction enzyme M protein